MYSILFFSLLYHIYLGHVEKMELQLPYMVYVWIFLTSKTITIMIQESGPEFILPSAQYSEPGSGIPV
jgi:hypothetical protein